MKLEDLDIKSILDLSEDENLELLRQIRLSRRVPVKKRRSPSTKKKAISNLDSNQVNEILKILGV